MVLALSQNCKPFGPAVILAFCLVISGCLEKAPPQDTLVVAISSEPKSIDPVFATDANGMRLVDLMFDSFVTLSKELKIVPQAISHYETKDFRVFDFFLKKDLKFWDSRPVTPADIEYTLKAYRNPQSPFASVFKDLKTWSVEKVPNSESLRVRLELTKANTGFLINLVPIKILRESTLPTANSRIPHFGTGPLQLESRTVNAIRLVDSAPERRASGSPSRYEFRVVRDDTTRLLKTLNEEIDITINEIAPEKLIHFKNKPQFQILTSSGLSMTYLLVNFKSPFLGDLNNRRAIKDAIDVPLLIEEKLMGQAVPATSLLTPEHPFHMAGLGEVRPKQQPKDGVRSALSSTPITLKSSNNQSSIQTVQILASWLREAGFQISMESFEWGTFYSDVQKGHFDLALMKWVGVVDPDIYRLAFHSEEVPPKGRNRGHYKNANLDRVLDLASSELDDQKRLTHYHLAQKMVFEDLAVIPLWYETQIAIVHQRVRGFELYPNGSFRALLNTKKQESQ